MLERFVGRLLCSLALLLLSSSVAVAADGNKEVFSPWTSAPSCVAGRACIYQLGSDKQLYGVDGNGVVTKLHGAKSFRTSMNCAGLSGPANGDVCFDTTLGYFRVYSGGWSTVALVYSSPLPSACWLVYYLVLLSVYVSVYWLAYWSPLAQLSPHRRRQSHLKAFHLR